MSEENLRLYEMQLGHHREQLEHGLLALTTATTAMLQDQQLPMPVARIIGDVHAGSVGVMQDIDAAIDALLGKVTGAEEYR